MTGRLGLASGRTLVYGKAGLAWGNGQSGITLEEAREANRRAQFLARSERRDPKNEAEKAAAAERERIDAERAMSEEGTLTVLAREFIDAKKLTAGTLGFAPPISIRASWALPCCRRWEASQLRK